MCGETFRLPLSAFATVAWKSFFNVTITVADVGSLKSVHTLFDKYLDHMLVKFDQDRVVRNKQNFELWGKKWFIFEKVLTPF